MHLETSEEWSTRGIFQLINDIGNADLPNKMNEVRVQITFSKYFSSDVNSRKRLPGTIIAQVFLKFILTRQKVTSTPIIVQLMLRKSKNTTMAIGSASLSLIFQKKVKLYTLKSELKWWREDTDIHESNNPYFIRY